MSRELRLDLFDWYDPIADLLKCLECNRWFCTIPAHIRSHKMSSDEYRERWGIFKTTPLSCKSFVLSRRENMLSLRQKGRVVVSVKGKIPNQLIGKSESYDKKAYKEFDQARLETSKRHKGKVVSAESRQKLSHALCGRVAHNKTEPITRLCERDKIAFSCMRWQPNKYCSKRCAMLSNKNWLKRKVLL